MSKTLSQERLSTFRERHRYLPQWLLAIASAEFLWNVILGRPF